MKIVNITNETEIQIYVKDIDGKDISVLLKPNNFIFCPTNEKTKSINLLLLKKNIEIIEIEKPQYLNYYISYKESESSYEDKPIQLEEVKSAVDSYINENVNESIEKNKEEDIVDSYINEEISILEVENVIQNKEKKKYKYKRKKKLGRKKKRGPKKKKKPLGRPKGSVPKVGRPKKKKSVGRPPKPKKSKNPVGRPKGSKNKKKKIKQIKPK